MVDWDLAVRIGVAVRRARVPTITGAEADTVVAELRHDAERSTGLVREFTGLSAGERTAPVLVVDRPGWVQANADGFATILTPAGRQDLLEEGRRPGPLGHAIGSRVTGAEVGLLLGFLGSARCSASSTRSSSRPGRLLLVAPNIVHVERELGADPTDFRLWVCLHEETHRVQFTAVPWMRDHLRTEIADLTETVEPTRMLEDGLKRFSESFRSDGGSLMDAMSTPEQKEVIDRITGVMSLLEGHADVVMDGVGPEVIPSVAAIRRKFTQRRKGVGSLDRLLRRLLGLDAKMAQYRDGADFVRGVVGKVGMEGFNAVWAGPEHLPSKDEITDPAAWVARVHG